MPLKETVSTVTVRAANLAEGDVVEEGLVPPPIVQEDEPKVRQETRQNDEDQQSNIYLGTMTTFLLDESVKPSWRPGTHRPSWPEELCSDRETGRSSAKQALSRRNCGTRVNGLSDSLSAELV